MWEHGSTSLGEDIFPSTAWSARPKPPSRARVVSSCPPRPGTRRSHVQQEVSRRRRLHRRRRRLRGPHAPAPSPGHPPRRQLHLEVPPHHPRAPQGTRPENPTDPSPPRNPSSRGPAESICRCCSRW
jgi:hypothetical protein